MPMTLEEIIDMQFVYVYCCACEREIKHETVQDEVLGKALECLVCHTAWEIDEED